MGAPAAERASRGARRGRAKARRAKLVPARCGEHRRAGLGQRLETDRALLSFRARRCRSLRGTGVPARNRGRGALRGLFVWRHALLRHFVFVLQVKVRQQIVKLPAGFDTLNI